jgi:MarR family 2-MHQ and catechol resistance regulon transcriptional repressor
VDGSDECKIGIADGGKGVHVFLVMWKAARALQACEQTVSELEMCGSDFAVLEELLHKGPLPVNEIGKKVLLTSGSITVAVDRLEAKGLVERRASGTDRRARIVHLTKEGRKLITRETIIRLLKKTGFEAAGASRTE